MTPIETTRSSGRPLWWWLVLAIAVLLLAIAAYLYWSPAPTPPVPAVPPPVSQAQPPAEPVVEHPVQPPATPPAPVALDDSDAAIAAALAELIDPKQIGNWFFTDSLARRFVATVDNLSRPSVAPRVRVFKPISGSFAVDKDGDEVVIAQSNAARYTPYVQALGHVDAKQLAGVYLHFYPLFQQAYQELGYPKGYFNDRLVFTIDHLLATPEPTGPLKLVQPKVMYQYADPELESLSAGQKALLRMGPDNRRRVKEKLRALRSEIARK
jgi:hypothetical protein